MTTTHSDGKIEYRLIESPCIEVEWCFDLVEKFFNEDNCLSGFNRDFAIHSWQTLLTSRSVAIYCAIVDNKVVGMLGFGLVPDLFTGKSQLQEVGWFVDASYRDSKIGIKLFTLFERYAIDKGAARISVTHLVDSMPDKLKSFYTRRGYNLQDLTYGKEL